MSLHYTIKVSKDHAQVMANWDIALDMSDTELISNFALNVDGKPLDTQCSGGNKACKSAAYSAMKSRITRLGAWTLVGASLGSFSSGRPTAPRFSAQVRRGDLHRSMPRRTEWANSASFSKADNDEQQASTVTDYRYVAAVFG